jgi:lipoyl(octanoyl) transferase
MHKAMLRTAWLGRVDYEQALNLQDALVAARHAETIGDILLLLEHPHVFTLGRGANEKFLLAPPPEVPVYRVSRGGQVTYHGPGQLIAYPILALEGAARDVHAYLRALEHVIVKTLASYGIDAGRREKLTGVWVGPRKIASIGVGIRRWITLHGLALNVNSDLSFFDRIVPCGIEGCQMTSIGRETHSDVGVITVAQSLADCFAAEFGYASIAPINPADLWRHCPASDRCGFEAYRG